jgi:hypothetical protein
MYLFLEPAGISISFTIVSFVKGLVILALIEFELSQT